jgi:aryl-alcohol dehydrogenase-like predicted oxidoreductase
MTAFSGMEEPMTVKKTPATAASAGTVRLGDLTVHRMGFGAMRLTGPGVWGEPPDRAAAKAVLHRALALGVNFIDTADSYGPEVSERLIAEALHPYPQGLIIATKGGFVRPPRSHAWVADGRPTHLRTVCEGSLRRLKVDRIDLYQLHTVDHRVPIEESVGALAQLQADGKIRHIGLSNVDVDQLARARKVVRIVSVQNLYNLKDRTSEGVVTACERDGLGFIPWYPLATGSLTRSKALGHIAARHEATPGQVALAWLLRRSAAMLPIPGTSSVAHLEENVAAATLRLTDEEFAELAR